MKRLKFLIVALGLFIAQGIYAVTLPSSSYNPYSSGNSGVGETSSVYSDGSVITGSYLQLGDGDYETTCQGDGNGRTLDGSKSCSECCMAFGKAIYDECHTYCMSGQEPLTPLDAPLWFMLALAALGAAFSVTMRKKLA